MKRLCLAAVVVVAASGPAAAGSPERTQVRELIGDPHFERGCRLYEPQTGKHVGYGMIAGIAGGAEPVWGLAQWSSREKLPAAPPEKLPTGALRYANAAKAVTFGPRGTPDADLTLAVNCGYEYQGHVRGKGDPWVHLLVEQRFVDPPLLSALARADLHIAARLTHLKKHKMPGYSPNLHAAHIQIFFTVQNLNKQSPGYGQYLWFGVPLFDDRHPFPKAYKARDAGKEDATGMFIYTVEGGEFTKRSAHDEKWITIDKDLLPFMKDGLQTARERGFLKDSQALEDYHISGMNLGWEVTGIFDAAFQIRDLGLKVTAQDRAGAGGP
jgi:hypothetical protein